MSGGRRRIAAKKPLTQPNSQRLQGRARNKHQRLIVRVHGLLKQRSNVAASDVLNETERTSQLAAIESELEQLGGMKAYQSASKRGEKHLNSAQWIARVLQEHTTPEQRRDGIWLVDVGALEPNYGRWAAWINAVSLDLTKRHPLVLELDFLRAQLSTLWAVCARLEARRRIAQKRTKSTTSDAKRSRTEGPKVHDNDDDDHDHDDDDNDGVVDDDDSVNDDDDDDDDADVIDFSLTADNQPPLSIVPRDFVGFQCIALSLVLNFEPSAAKRGQMLCKARSLLAARGFVAIVLPLATIDNSRYCDEPTLVELMRRLQFQLLLLHRSPKLFYALFRLVDNAAPMAVPSFQPMARKQVRRGPKCNNFCIELLE